jgi:SAM-dependent methyltransferase
MSDEHPSTTHFDQWAAEGLDAAMEAEHGDVVRQVLERLELRPGEQILDLGCGNGWATRLLAKASPGATAVGIDLSPAMVARADELHSFTIRARYEIAAFEALPFGDARFDRAFSMEALYYASDLDRALAEVLRVLKPGAPLDVIVDYYKESPQTESWECAFGVPVVWLGQEEWGRRLEQAGFADVRFERVVDRRGAGPEADFEPSHCYSDYATWKAIREAGSLWIHGRRPA